MELRGAVAFEAVESRLLLATHVPVDTTDATYSLVIDGVNTIAQPIRVGSFGVGLGRVIAAPTGSSTDREANSPSGGDVGMSLLAGAHTAALMQAAFDGRVFPRATLIAHRPGNVGYEYERWTLDEVLVTSYQTAAGSGPAQEGVTLNYARLVVQLQPRDTAGQSWPLGASAGYDFKADKAVGSTPQFGGLFFDPALEHVLEVGGGQIPITSYDWAVSRSPGTGGTTGGTGGTASVADFTFYAPGGVHTPALLAGAAYGEAFDAVLTSRDSSGRVYSRWVLQDGMLSGYSTNDAADDGAPRLDTFTLDVVRLERAYYDYDTGGKMSGTTQTGWDVATNKSFTTGSLALTTGFAEIDPVSPDPRSTPLNTLTIRFAEKVTAAPGLNMFELFRDGRRLTLPALSVSSPDGGLTWHVGGLSGATAAGGRYTFNVFAAGANLEGVTGADVVQGDTVSWVMDTTAPAATASLARPVGASPLVVRVTFSEAVTDLQAADLSLLPLPGGSAGHKPASVSWDAGTRTATFTFAGPLPDGNYRATIARADVRDAAGNALAADVAVDTFVLAGDVNRDRAVNFDDLLILASNYNKAGKAWADGDLDGSGTVNFDDLLILAGRYNRTLAAPAPVPPAAPLAASVRATTSVVRDEAEGTSTFSTTRVSRPAPAKPKPAAVRPRR